MKILIVGGSGFIGQQLCAHFTKQGIEVDILTRSLNNKRDLNNLVNFLTELNPEDGAYEIIINLAGEPLNKKRWNDEVKKNIYLSRIQTTQKLISFIANAKSKPKLLISGSAIGFYGNNAEVIFTENSSHTDDGFTHKLCHDWESIANQASNYGVRVCIMRTGIVLYMNGGALKEMIPAFNLGFGCQLGDGHQWMSWIHMDDVVGAIEFLIQNESLNGPFNFTAPEAVTNKEFSNELASSLNRPCFLRIPDFMVEIIFGEMGKTLLLQGQRVVPDKLIKAGYKFKFPILSNALQDILK